MPKPSILIRISEVSGVSDPYLLDCTVRNEYELNHAAAGKGMLNESGETQVEVLSLRVVWVARLPTIAAIVESLLEALQNHWRTTPPTISRNMNILARAFGRDLLRLCGGGKRGHGLGCDATVQRQSVMALINMGRAHGVPHGKAALCDTAYGVPSILPAQIAGIGYIATPSKCKEAQASLTTMGRRDMIWQFYQTDLRVSPKSKAMTARET